MDRGLIRVDFPVAQAGIAAALRRAFQTPVLGREACERSFDELLKRLN